MNLKWILLPGSISKGRLHFRKWFYFLFCGAFHCQVVVTENKAERKKTTLQNRVSNLLSWNLVLCANVWLGESKRVWQSFAMTNRNNYPLIEYFEIAIHCAFNYNVSNLDAMGKKRSRRREKKSHRKNMKTSGN